MECSNTQFAERHINLMKVLKQLESDLVITKNREIASCHRVGSQGRTIAEVSHN